MFLVNTVLSEGIWETLNKCPFTSLVCLEPEAHGQGLIIRYPYLKSRPTQTCLNVFQKETQGMEEKSP